MATLAGIFSFYPIRNRTSETWHLWDSVPIILWDSEGLLGKDIPYECTRCLRDMQKLDGEAIGIAFFGLKTQDMHEHGSWETFKYCETKQRNRAQIWIHLRWVSEVLKAPVCMKSSQFHCFCFQQMGTLCSNLETQTRQLATKNGVVFWNTSFHIMFVLAYSCHI